MAKIQCLYSVFLLAVLLDIVNSEAVRPDYLRLCSRTDPNLSQCLIDKAYGLIPNLLKGDPQIGLPSMDPFVVDIVRIDREITQHVREKLTLKNLMFYNLESVDIQAARPRIEDSVFDLEADLRFPVMKVNGNYKSEASFRNIPIITKGIFNFTLYEVTFTLKLIGKPYKHEGEEYLQINELHMRPEIGNMHIYISDILFGNNNNNNNILSEIALEFLNRYWYYFYNEFLPDYEEKWEPIIKDIVNRVLSRVPYDHMFPA